MRSRVEAGRFELVTHVVKYCKAAGLAGRLQQPLHRKHPETNGFHVKRGDGAPQRLGRFNEFFGIGRRGKALHKGKQVIKLGEGLGSPF